MKRALVFRGGWDGHQPVQTSDFIAAELRKRDMEVDLFNDQECLLQPGLEEKYDVIIPVWTMGSLIPGAEQALCKAVKSGVDIAGWHGGMCDAFRQNTEYQFMTGGQWVAHPGNIRDYTVEITSDDPIVAGIVKTFPMHSEQYYMHVDPSNEVLAVTRYDDSICPWIKGTVMPVVWKRHYGKGKVFFCSLGHTLDDFINTPQSAEITVRGILWAAR